MGALIPLAITIAPEIARWLFGASAERTVTAVARAATAVTGTADDVAQREAIARDPDMAIKLRVELAKLAAEAEQEARKADISELSSRLADTASARAQTIALAQAHSPVAYAAPIVSALVLLTFGIVMALTLTRAVPPGSETAINMLLGSLAAMATSVVSYWVGSSAGSARKDDRIARLVATQ